MVGNVLVVDDDTMLADAVAGSLRRAGYPTLTAYSCQEALAAVEQDPTGLLVLDLTLPDGDGLSLLQALRQKSLPAETPVIVVSSRLVTRSELRSHKVTEFLPKPFDVRRLLSRVEALTGD